MSFKGGPDRDPAPPGAEENSLIEERGEEPSIPGLSGWKSVYWFVFAFFILCIALMRALQEFFR